MDREHVHFFEGCRKGVIGKRTPPAAQNENVRSKRADLLVPMRIRKWSVWSGLISWETGTFFV